MILHYQRRGNIVILIKFLISMQPVHLASIVHLVHPPTVVQHLTLVQLPPLVHFLPLVHLLMIVHTYASYVLQTLTDQIKWLLLSASVWMTTSENVTTDNTCPSLLRPSNEQVCTGCTRKTFLYIILYEPDVHKIPADNALLKKLPTVSSV